MRTNDELYIFVEGGVYVFQFDDLVDFVKPGLRIHYPESYAFAARYQKWYVFHPSKCDYIQTPESDVLKEYRAALLLLQ